MAGLKFTLEADVKKLQELRKEIEKVTVAIGKLPSDSPQIRKLEAQLSKLRKEYDGIETLLSKVQLMGEELAKSEDLIKHTRKQTNETKKATEHFEAEAGSLAALEKQAKSLTKEWFAMSEARKQSDVGQGKVNELAKVNAQIKIEKDNLRALQKEYVNTQKIQDLQEGSIKSLRAELSNLNAVYDSLGRSQRKGAYGKELLNGIQTVYKELVEAEQASGRFQRTVGQYERAWDGLGFSVQQVARELPSLAVSANTFFLAISNNLPILADEIKRARIHFEALKKSGQTATPVWKQVVSSIVSWQTALTVGITLLTLYGDKLVKWISGLGKAKEADDNLLSAEQELALARKSAWGNIAKEQSQLDILYNKLKNVTLSTTERNAAVREWVKNYKTHSDILDGEKVSIDKLKQSYAALSKEIYNKAVADKYSERAAELAVKIADARTKANYQLKDVLEAQAKSQNAQREYEEKQRQYGNTDNYDEQQELLRFKMAASTAKNQLNSQQKIQEQLKKNLANLTDTYNVFIDQINKYQPFATPKEGTYDYWQQQVEIADNALKQIQDSYLKVLKTGSTQGVPEEVAKQYNALIKQKTEAEEKLKIYDDKGLTKEYNSIVDQNQKISSLMDKQSIERKRREEDLENQAIQSRIDTMTEGEAKIRAQRELDNKKEIQDLERQREDYIRTEIEYQKKLFDAQEELNAKKSKDYKKKTFDPSTVKVDTSKFNELISNELIQQSIAPYKEEAQAWNEYLVEYGNFQQKKVAINAEYNQKIVKATTKGEKESLKKEWDSKLKEVTFDELKKSINFADIFGDLDTQSTETLTKMRDKLKEIIDKSAKDLKPTDLKALQEAFSNIDLKIVERNPFGELKQGIEGYKSATEAVIKAQEDLNTVQEGGEVIIGQYTDKTGKVVTKLLTQEQAERNLSDAQKERLESQGKLTKAVNSIGQQGQQLVNAGNNLVDMLTNLGVAVPESISGALSGLGQIMSGLESIDLTKPFSIISSTTGILAGITKTISSFFGGPDGTAYYEGVKEQLEAINEVYDRIIDKSKEDIVFGGGFASVQAATQAMDNYEKKVINLQKIAAASGRAGASWKSHSAEWHSNKNVGAIGGFEQMSDILGKSISSMTDLYSLSGDELFLIQSQMPEAWSLIDARIRENLDSIVACKDEANELRDALNQAMTGVDFDSFYNGFIDQLSDMDTSFEDMCDNFEDYLRKSIMAGLVASQYQGRINALYEQWSDAARSDSKITKNEADLIKEQYQQIVEDMMHDREEMFKTFGWDTSATSQESSKKGFATASQDSIDELNGRFTALQIAGEEIKNQSVEQTRLLDSINSILLNIDPSQASFKIPDLSLNREALNSSFAADIAMRAESNAQLQAAIVNLTGEVQTIKNNVSEMLTFSAEDRIDQQTIAENSSNLNKNLPKITQALDGIKQNTNGLSRR